MRFLEEAYTNQVRKNLFIDGGTDPFAHCALGLCGEAGEVADIIKKSQYKGRTLDKEHQEHLIEELGDTLWYLTALADRLGVTLGYLMEHNIAKLADRYPGRYTDLKQLDLGL